MSGHHINDSAEYEEVSYMRPKVGNQNDGTRRDIKCDSSGLLRPGCQTCSSLCQEIARPISSNTNNPQRRTFFSNARRLSFASDKTREPHRELSYTSTTRPYALEMRQSILQMPGPMRESIQALSMREDMQRQMKRINKMNSVVSVRRKSISSGMDIPELMVLKTSTRSTSSDYSDSIGRIVYASMHKRNFPILMDNQQIMSPRVSVRLRPENMQNVDRRYKTDTSESAKDSIGRRYKTDTSESAKDSIGRRHKTDNSDSAKDSIGRRHKTDTSDSAKDSIGRRHKADTSDSAKDSIGRRHKTDTSGSTMDSIGRRYKTETSGSTMDSIGHRYKLDTSERERDSIGCYSEGASGFRHMESTGETRPPPVPRSSRIYMRLPKDPPSQMSSGDEEDGDGEEEKKEKEDGDGEEKEEEEKNEKEQEGEKVKKKDGEWEEEGKGTGRGAVKGKQDEEEEDQQESDTACTSIDSDLEKFVSLTLTDRSEDESNCDLPLDKTTGAPTDKSGKHKKATKTQPKSDKWTLKGRNVSDKYLWSLSENMFAGGSYSGFKQSFYSITQGMQLEPERNRMTPYLPKKRARNIF